MSEIETTRTAELEQVLSHIRSAVRRERPYIVGGAPNIEVKLNQNECPLDLPEDFKRAFRDCMRNRGHNVIG